MRKLFDLIGMTAGGYLGWYLGALVSIYSAFMIGMIGTGAGLYYARRWTKNLIP